jgi:hypothetical protein
MKKPKYLGGRKNVRGDMQQEAQDGRQRQNRNHKASFKSGAQDARDSDGLFTVTQPRQVKRSPAARAMSHRTAVARPGKAGQTDAQ